MADLPDDVALLWGRREAPRRGPKAALTVDGIVAAAVAVADADGLEAVSMARVAAELGNATMALYRHVRSKEELLTLMSDAALAGPPELPDGDWRAALTTWTVAIVGQYRRHPWYAQLPISGPPVGPNNLAWFDRGLAALAVTGLPEPDKVGIVLALTTFVRGQVRVSADLRAGYARNPDAFGSGYGAVLAQVADPSRFPALGRAVAGGVFDEDAAPDGDIEVDLAQDFRFGLDLFLDGVAAHLGRR